MNSLMKQFDSGDVDKSVSIRPQEHGDSLFYPVDDDDIQSGTSDAIELKPARSNEDAFFIIPENPQVLQCILFIQISIDLLKKYLPTICSRNLEISKEKQIKIFGLLDKIEEFLSGESKEDHILQGDATKARERLNWTPEVSFDVLVREMVDGDLARFSKMG